MRKIISFMHISLGGFVAGSKEEMNWIKVDEEILKYQHLSFIVLCSKKMD